MRVEQLITWFVTHNFIPVIFAWILFTVAMFSVTIKIEGLEKRISVLESRQQTAGKTIEEVEGKVNIIAESLPTTTPTKAPTIRRTVTQTPSQTPNNN